MKEIGHGLAWVVVDVRGLVQRGGEEGKGTVESAAKGLMRWGARGLVMCRRRDLGQGEVVLPKGC